MVMNTEAEGTVGAFGGDVMIDLDLQCGKIQWKYLIEFDYCKLSGPDKILCFMVLKVNFVNDGNYFINLIMYYACQYM